MIAPSVPLKKCRPPVRFLKVESDVELEKKSSEKHTDVLAYLP
jgi:hypothetical protein